MPKLASPPQLGTVEVVSVLGALCALYATFVAAQLVALTGGAEHVLTTSGLTYAEYARSGFFQLLAAAGLTLVILLSVRACADRRRLSVLAVSEATIALTLCVVVIAIRRLDLYETAYGLTMLRLASTVTAVWIGIVFLLLAVVVANRRSVGRWFAPAVVASAVLFVGIWAAANPAAIVTETNVRRATHGAPFDVGQAVSLGPDAVPALVRGLDDLPPPDAQLVRRSLCQSMADDEGRAYNRSTSDADAALEPICSAR